MKTLHLATSVALSFATVTCAVAQSMSCSTFGNITRCDQLPDMSNLLQGPVNSARNAWAQKPQVDAQHRVDQQKQQADQARLMQQQAILELQAENLRLQNEMLRLKQLQLASSPVRSDNEVPAVDDYQMLIAAYRESLTQHSHDLSSGSVSEAEIAKLAELKVETKLGRRIADATRVRFSNWRDAGAEHNRPVNSADAGAGS